MPHAHDTVVITAAPLEVYSPHALVTDAAAGGIAVFVGTTRDTFDGRVVVKLEYECYEAMAVKELHALCDAVRARWREVRRIFVAHRTGVVAVAEASVIIAVSSVHRADCLEATHWAIDELKRRVPIWKKEIYNDSIDTHAHAEDHDHADAHTDTISGPSSGTGTGTSTSSSAGPGGGGGGSQWKINSEAFQISELSKQTTDFAMNHPRTSLTPSPSPSPPATVDH